MSSYFGSGTLDTALAPAFYLLIVSLWNCF